MLNPLQKSENVQSPVAPNQTPNQTPVFNKPKVNTFDLSHAHNTSMRFGEITPTLCMDCVSGDRIMLDQSHQLFSNPFHNKFLNSMKLNKDSFFVPLTSMMPHSAEYLMVNPKRGDDLPDMAKPVFYLPGIVIDILGFDMIFDKRDDIPEDLGFLNSSSLPTDGFINVFDVFDENGANFGLSPNKFKPLLITTLLRNWLSFDSLFGAGSLADNLGMRVDPAFSRFVCETAFNFLNDLEVNSVRVGRAVDFYNIGGNGLKDYSSSYADSLKYVRFPISTPSERRALCDVMKTGEYVITGLFNGATPVDLTDSFASSTLVMRIKEIAGELVPYVLGVDSFFISFSGLKGASSKGVAPRFESDLDCIGVYGDVMNPEYGFYSVLPFIAYQQTCAHFYTNDNIDEVYSSKLYLSSLQTCLRYNGLRARSDETFNFNKVPAFSYNGSLVEADVISLSYLTQYRQQKTGVESDSMNGGFLMNYNTSPLTWCVDYTNFMYYASIFALNNSLSSMDYFTSARSYPLAVGNVNIGVNTDNMKVSAIDVTRNIVLQKFLNTVNRIGSRFSEYMLGVFGVRPSTEEPAPSFISHYCNDVAIQQNTNLADSNGEVNSTINDNTEPQRVLDIYIDTPGFLISVAYFTIQRNYNNSLAPYFSHIDRFSMFNPLFQEIGDQPVMVNFMDWKYPMKPFGYTTRYGEYKEMFSTNHGVFRLDDVLPASTFTFEVPRIARFEYNDNSPVICSAFLRHYPYELDKYFSSLTAADISSYYHFLGTFGNTIKANRPISYSPGILNS
ncbi:major capsid protein [Capybara microvirus Cap1_SP_51]|nr:major capsid protein [Capybara microvirus Cap1_SP_51]